MNKYKIALGLAGIAAAGVVAGLLIAPRKGKKLRKKIRKKSSQIIKDIDGLFSRHPGTPQQNDSAAEAGI
jgi:gas vesicle protein